MQYKTITLELFQQYPTLHRNHQQHGTLLQALTQYAQTLKDRHHSWMDTLSESRPESAGEQTASEALELAIQDLREALSAGCTTNDPEMEQPSLDAAMAFLRRHTPPA